MPYKMFIFTLPCTLPNYTRGPCMYLLMKLNYYIFFKKIDFFCAYEQGMYQIYAGAKPRCLDWNGDAILKNMQAPVIFMKKQETVWWHFPVSQQGLSHAVLDQGGKNMRTPATLLKTYQMGRGLATPSGMDRGKLCRLVQLLLCKQVQLVKYQVNICWKMCSKYIDMILIFVSKLCCSKQQF